MYLVPVIWLREEGREGGREGERGGGKRGRKEEEERKREGGKADRFQIMVSSTVSQKVRSRVY